MSRQITAKDLEDFLAYFKKRENDGYGLCHCTSWYLGVSSLSKNPLDDFFWDRRPLSAIRRIAKYQDTKNSERNYWWKSDDKAPRIRFLEEHIKALKMNPIKRYFYRIYLFFTL